LVRATAPDGAPLVRGRRVTGFTNEEEAAVGLTEEVPFLLETRLRELGGDFLGAPKFAANAVRDGRLVTGQNPASAEPVAHHVLAALAETRRLAGG
jgi:putative intracellular protease/amidase